MRRHFVLLPMLDFANPSLHLARTSSQVDPKDAGLCEDEASGEEEKREDDDQHGGKRIDGKKIQK